MSAVLTADTVAGIQSIFFEPFGHQIKVLVTGTDTNQCLMTTEVKVAACMIKNLKDLNAEDKVRYSQGFLVEDIARLGSPDSDLANTQTKTDRAFQQLLASSMPSQSATSSWIDTAGKIAVCALMAIAASALTFGTIYLSIGVIYAAYIIVATNPIATLSVVGAISAFVGTVCFFSGLDKF